jgi:hypothetical protein
MCWYLLETLVLWEFLLLVALRRSWWEIRGDFEVGCWQLELLLKPDWLEIMGE